MKQRVIHVFTHDSIGLGEDGPTHQSDRARGGAAPDSRARRLAPGRHRRDARSRGRARSRTAHRPTALLLSRQSLPYLPKARLDDIAKGAYVLAEPSEVGLRRRAQAVIIGTGSEVQLALHAQALLAKDGIAVRVVSMPSTTVFDRQGVAYKTQRVARGAAAHRGGGGRHRRLVEVRLRRGGRHRHLRRVGAGRRAVQAFRLHRRKRRRDGARSARTLTGCP